VNPFAQHSAAARRLGKSKTGL